MTDNEIIKALECHADTDIETCKICAYNGVAKCGHQLCYDALDLINRQKAEIERLKDYPKCVYEYDGDITDYCLKTPCPNYKTVDAIKAEAVKEFAERLKEYVESYDVTTGYKIIIVNAVEEETIDNLVKETVGEG